VKKLLEELKETLRTNQSVDWNENSPALEFRALEKKVDEIIAREKKIIELTKEKSPEEIEVEKAGEYLLVDDMTLEDQIQTIKNHPDQSDLIDHVDGVDVWEAVEFRFSCKDFLDLIT